MTGISSFDGQPVEFVTFSDLPPQEQDRVALTAIAAILRDPEWDAETVERVAEIVRLVRNLH